MHDKFREGLLEHKMLDLVSETTCRLSRHSFELWQAVKKINVNFFLKKKTIFISELSRNKQIS